MTMMIKGDMTRAQKFIYALAGTEERRFIVGSVAIPLVIACLTITVGTKLAANYQDWQDRRARDRNLVVAIREAATSLSINLEALAQKGGGVERLKSKQTVLDEDRAVEESLERLQGMSKALSSHAIASSSFKGPATLAEEINVCRKAVDTYDTCLAEALSNSVQGDATCTLKFREDMTRDGSCTSLRTAIYSLAE